MKRLVPALAAAILGAILASVQPRAYAQQPPVDIPAGLLAKAQSDGTVRVIVGVREAFTPEGYLTATEVVGQRQAIVRAQEAVINRLEGFGRTNARQFTYIPYFAAELNPVALSALASMPDVASVGEDIPCRRRSPRAFR